MKLSQTLMIQSHLTSFLLIKPVNSQISGESEKKRRLENEMHEQFWIK